MLAVLDSRGGRGFSQNENTGDTWGKLTDDDLDRINGNREQLEGKMQERYGYEKDQTCRDVDDWYGRQTWTR